MHRFSSQHIVTQLKECQARFLFISLHSQLAFSSLISQPLTFSPPCSCLCQPWLLIPRVTWYSVLLLMTTFPNHEPIISSLSCFLLSSAISLPTFQANILPQVDVNVFSESDTRWQARTPNTGTGLAIHSMVVESMHQRLVRGLKRRHPASTFPCLLRCPKLTALAGLFTSSSTKSLISECRSTPFHPFSSRTWLCVFHSCL